MRHLRLILLSILLVLGTLAACGIADNNENVNNNDNNNIEENVNENNEENNEENEASDEVEYPVTVTDGFGEEFTMEEEPKTIVSLMPSNTEIAYALDLGEKMVAGSDHDNYPEEALELEKVGGMELNIEAILALEPDLVLAHPGNDPDAIEQLEDSDLAVYVVQDATNFDEVYESIEAVAQITGSAAKGEEIIETMQADLEEIVETAESIEEDDMKTVYIEISPEPEIYTPGKGTFEDDILSLINAVNGAADEDGWVMISEEAVIEMNPDVIIATYDYVEDIEEGIMSRDGWGDITAVQDEAVVVVDTDLVSRPGPRLVEGALELAKAIYPDVFNE